MKYLLPPVFFGGLLNTNIRRTPPFPLRKILGGRYFLLDFLGQGGLATVYKAVDISTLSSYFYTLKVIDADLEDSEKAFALTKREAQLIDIIKHKSTIEVLDIGIEDNYPYLVMPFIEGETLAQRLRRKEEAPFYFEDSCRWISTISDVLISAHDKGIIHADIKTGNIFIDQDDNALLFDFGSARKKKTISKSEEELELLIAELSMVSPGYASPERLLGNLPEKEDDIFSLGIIVYILFSGKHPFNRMNSLEAQDSDFNIALIPHLNQEQWQVISDSLAFDKYKRLNDVSAFKCVFQEIMQPNYEQRFLA